MGRPRTVLPINIDLSDIPDVPGIYIFKDRNGKVMYVGSSTRLDQRVKNQLRRQSFARAGSVSFVEYEVVDDVTQIKPIEASLADALNPVYHPSSRRPRLSPQPGVIKLVGSFPSKCGTIHVGSEVQSCSFMTSIKSVEDNGNSSVKMIPLSPAIASLFANNSIVEVTVKPITGSKK